MKPTLGPRKAVYLLQRKTTTLGKGLGKTTGWIHRTVLRNKGVISMPGASYDKVDDAGLHVTLTAKDGSKTQQVLDVDSVVICAGQACPPPSLCPRFLHARASLPTCCTLPLHLSTPSVLSSHLRAPRHCPSPACIRSNLGRSPCASSRGSWQRQA